MSFKAKNLSYDAEASQPAFLRRLRGEITSDDSARHERPIPRNKRLKQDDDEDAPAYVMEDTNQLLTQAEYEALVAGKDPNDPDASKDTGKPATGEPETGAADSQKIKDNIAEMGKPTKKRKAIKVIGGDDDAEKNSSIKKTDAKAVKKPKKKAKPVKLTFGDEDEG